LVGFGTNEAFVGKDRGYWNHFSYSEEGSIHVYVRFSEVPVSAKSFLLLSSSHINRISNCRRPTPASWLGEEVVSYDSSQAWGTTFSVSYNVGDGE
jgi:hypothetical protein